MPRATPPRGRFATLRSAARALRALGRHSGTALGALLCLLAGSLFAIAGPWVIRLLVDQGLTPGNVRRISFFAAIFLGTEILRQGADYFQSGLQRRLGQLASKTLREEVFLHLQSVSPAYYEENLAGGAVTRVTSDADAVGDAVSTGMVGILRDILVLVGTGTALVALHPKFGLSTLAASLLVAVPAVFLRHSAASASRLGMEAIAGTNEVLEENLAGRDVIRLFGIEKIREERFCKENRGLLEAAFRSLRVRTIFDAGGAVSQALALSVVIALGGTLLESGHLTLGLWLAFVQYVPFLLGGVGGIAEKGMTLHSGLAAGERLFDILDLPHNLPAHPEPAARETSGQEIAISDVRFGYRGGEEVLKGVSAIIRRGERVALVGRTGAGKTTLARLVARIHDPWHGTLRWRGRDLRSIPIQELRKEIVYLTQEVWVFSGTVFENVALGNPAIKRSEVMAACREVGAHEFIERLPQGYETPLVEGGRSLSVGERQLLSFARVLVRRPQVLILDEPTANVDPKTEDHILKALGRILEGRSSLIIAHRMSTLRGCDRVWVMRGGEMTQEKSPQEALRTSGLLG